MRKILLVFVCFTFLLPATAAFAVNFSKFNHLVVFGDSLSDNGNLYFLSKGAAPPFPAYGTTTFPGRFTDGQNWVDYFPVVVGNFGSITAFYSNMANGTNVAVGGSTSANLLQPAPSIFPPNPTLPAQISDYVESKPGHRVPNDDLYVIWIGANDFAARIPPEETMANIRQGIATLAKAGAKHFIVIDLPDISLTPLVKALGSVTVQEARQFVTAVNVLLAVEIPVSAWLERINITLVEINTIFVPIVMNPVLFGFSDSSHAAFTVPNGPLATDPNDYVFWDGFHPTTRAHLITAQFIYQFASFRFDFSVLSSR
jgi:outer membrane lipase/esterase